MNAATRRSWLPASLAIAWDRASARERRVVVVGVLALVLAAAWALAWRPLQADIERTREALARSTAALAQARALVDESAALARDSVPKGSADPRAAIARVLAERDLRPSGRLELQEGRVKVVLADALGR
jgi:type II secretory pathway component PulM